VQSHVDEKLRHNINSATSGNGVGKVIGKKSKPKETDSIVTLSDEDDNASHRKVSHSAHSEVSNDYLNQQYLTFFLIAYAHLYQQ